MNVLLAQSVVAFQAFRGGGTLQQGSECWHPPPPTPHPAGPSLGVWMMYGPRLVVKAPVGPQSVLGSGAVRSAGRGAPDGVINTAHQ